MGTIVPMMVGTIVPMIDLQLGTIVPIRPLFSILCSLCNSLNRY